MADGKAGVVTTCPTCPRALPYWTPITLARRSLPACSSLAPTTIYIHCHSIPSTIIVTFALVVCGHRHPHTLATPHDVIAATEPPSPGGHLVTYRATTTMFHQLDVVGEYLCCASIRGCMFCWIGIRHALVLVN